MKIVYRDDRLQPVSFNITVFSRHGLDQIGPHLKKYYRERKQRKAFVHFAYAQLVHSNAGYWVFKSIFVFISIKLSSNNKIQYSRCGGVVVRLSDLQP